MLFLRTELKRIQYSWLNSTTKIEVLAKCALGKWCFHNSSYPHHHIHTTEHPYYVCFSLMFLTIGYIKNKMYPLPGIESHRKRFKTRLMNKKFPKPRKLSSDHFSVLGYATTE